MSMSSVTTYWGIVRAVVVVSAAVLSLGSAAQAAAANLALMATPSTSYVSPWETLGAINDGYNPSNSRDKGPAAYGNWPHLGTEWVQYDWSAAISTSKIEVYWWSDGQGIDLPKACQLLYWNGSAFVPVSGAVGLGVAGNQYNTTTFSTVTTTALRLTIDSTANKSTGILEWKVYAEGDVPNFPPRVEAGPDRTVVASGVTYLNGAVIDDAQALPSPNVAWSVDSGPGVVAFDDAGSAVTSARIMQAGDYVLQLTADDGQLSASDTLAVAAVPLPPATHLDPVYMQTYKIDNPLWSDRVKKLITNWIPHCYTQLSSLNLAEGGINNFIQAGNKLAGRAYTRHVGYVFANAYVHNTVESMCVALMVDPQGDSEIIAAQNAMRAKLEDWIPKILSAQESDGYLQTYFTLGGGAHWTDKGAHEGYTAGYFIESAIAHYQMTGRTDPRLYNAAKKLADCWYNNIGPAPKKTWYDGHEEMEQALVRLGRFVNDCEGQGKGQKYVDLAKFLLDSRKGGEPYDQSHLPVVQQYEAVGHAVRAAYLYSGMTDVAMETNDIDYQSAVLSLWDNIVNRKYYVTGGIGSGETSEGFGGDYSLPNNAYCESCSGYGELFFQYKMNLWTHDARYADLYEETLYNAILGSIDLAGNNFTYTNPLDSSEARYAWHGCPCCVGNIPRTLLALPTWMYARSADAVYVNLFIGSTVTVGEVAGASVQMVQETNYPWSGAVSITVNPATATRFDVRIRVPNRNVSGLYTSTPAVSGITSISVNGTPVTPTIDRGYVVIDRTWTAGDKIDLVLPLAVQRVKADDKVTADVGRVALRYGPLIYNVESVDQNVDSVLSPTAPLSILWSPSLLNGVVAIKGAYTNGAALTAIPNYARLNRGGQSLVWIKDR
jgi:DUF1680 family protein